MTAAELKKMKESYAAALKEHARPVVAEQLKAFFDAFPDVEAVRWTQYTPYFNDGDACTFGVHDPGVQLKSATVDEDADEYYRWPEAWSLRESNPALAEGLKTLRSSLDADVCEVAFGDHVQVIAKRDGSVEASDYSHD